jgi:hypothetical protein
VRSTNGAVQAVSSRNSERPSSRNVAARPGTASYRLRTQNKADSRIRAA